MTTGTIELNAQQLSVLARCPIPSGEEEFTSTRPYKNRFFALSGENRREIDQNEAIRQLIKGIEQIYPDFYDENHTTVALPSDDKGVLVKNIKSWLTGEKNTDVKFPVKIDIAANRLSEETLHFCESYDLWEPVLTTIEIIEKCFSTMRCLNLETETDSETGEKWLLFDIDVEGEVDEILDDYDTYTEHFINQVSLKDQYKICLSYNVV